MLRTKKTQTAYNKYLKNPFDCPFCVREPIKKFKHWAIFKNDFPYDKILKKHLLLCPRRHATELNVRELRELRIIMKVLNKKNFADAIMQNFKKNQSVKCHFHFHLINYG